MVILYGRGFIVRPKSVLRSNSCPGTFSIRSLWSSVVRKTNISKRAYPSPRQRLFPMPKMRTFSVSSLLRMSDDPRKRSGRNVSGSPQRSLETKAENKYLSMKKKILKVTDTIPSLHKQAEIIIWWRLFVATHISWLTWYWLMNTHVSLGMKYPFRVMFLVVLKGKKTHRSFKKQYKRL